MIDIWKNSFAKCFKRNKKFKEWNLHNFEHFYVPKKIETVTLLRLNLKL